MEKHNFRKGDGVKMHGQDCIGEIVGISGRHATVAFGAIEVNIPLKRLEKAQQPTEAMLYTYSNRSATHKLHLDAGAFVAFRPEIDLHGMSVSQALSALDKWIDKAYLLGYKELKIIHGKGTGILRGAIRTHLQSHSQIKCVIVQRPHPGDGGVTWVEVA